MLASKISISGLMLLRCMSLAKSSINWGLLAYTELAKLTDPVVKLAISERSFRRSFLSS